MDQQRQRQRQRSVLGAIDRLYRVGTAAGLSDGQLVERFATRHDEAAEAAFAALVERHGPMVLRVCRRVLDDAHDAQDAFQATFLILVRQVGTVRRRESLASWLYGVALRVATRSRAASARRRAVEQAAGPRPAPGSASVDYYPEVWDEVDRLPERYRQAVVLCYLEGLTHEQAAQRLGWPVGTVRSRLARARERLRGRLARRGLAPGGAALAGAGLLSRTDAIPLSPDIVDPTVKAAMLVAACDAAEAGLVSASAAALTEGVLRTMLFAKLKSAAFALLTTGAVAVAAGVGVYGYQEPRPRPQPSPRPAPIAEDVAPAATAPAVGDDAEDPGGTPPPIAQDPTRRTQRARLREERDRAERFASYAVRVAELARAALEQQDAGDLGTASETTRKIEVLAREWDWMLRHPDADEPPDFPMPPSPPPAAPSTGAIRSDDQPPATTRAPLFKKKKAPTYTDPKRESTIRPDDEPSTMPAAPRGPGRPDGSGPPPAPPVPPVPPAPPAPPAEPALPPAAPTMSRAATAPAAPPGDNDRRLDEVERQLERVLRLLEGESRSRPIPRSLPARPGSSNDPRDPFSIEPPAPARPPAPPRPPEPPGPSGVSYEEF